MRNDEWGIIVNLLFNPGTMKECCGSYFIRNGELKSAVEFNNDLVYKGDTFYEVIRLVKGTPVFFENHIGRLSSGISSRKKGMIANAETIREAFMMLTQKEKRREINIKVVFNYKEEEENWLIYYIESAYPTPEQYRKGVKGILFWGERKDPGTKILDYSLRSAIYRELAEENAYEALLVNNENMITEGSKSNVFFLKNGKLFTAPDEMILKGVTRKYILQICREEKIEIDYMCVNADDISDYEAVFMTGTSPMVLPYYCINETWFDVNLPLLEKLRNRYLEKVEESIMEFNAGAERRK